jgi:hypothetical protein
VQRDKSGRLEKIVEVASIDLTGEMEKAETLRVKVTDQRKFVKCIYNTKKKGPKIDTTSFKTKVEAPTDQLWIKIK